MPDTCPICGNEEPLWEWGGHGLRVVWLCNECYRYEADLMYTAVMRMAEAYEQRRTDVFENLVDILRGNHFDPNFVESRFITATLPDDAGGKKVQYDTLTTQFSVYKEGEVEADMPDCDYTD